VRNQSCRTCDFGNHGQQANELFDIRPFKDHSDRDGEIKVIAPRLTLQKEVDDLNAELERLQAEKPQDLYAFLSPSFPLPLGGLKVGGIGKGIGKSELGVLSRVIPKPLLLE